VKTFKRLVWNLCDHIQMTKVSLLASKEIRKAKRHDRKFVFRGRAE